jgi:hypothetical protein
MVEREVFFGYVLKKGIMNDLDCPDESNEYKSKNGLYCIKDLHIEFRLLLFITWLSCFLLMAVKRAESVSELLPLFF